MILLLATDYIYFFFNKQIGWIEQLDNLRTIFINSFNILTYKLISEVENQQKSQWISPKMNRVHSGRGVKFKIKTSSTYRPWISFVVGNFGLINNEREGNQRN